jgi:release factor glutamine methyltransferase
VKLKEALALACDTLDSAGIENARLESEILVRYVFNLSRTRLYLDLDQTITPGQREAFFKLVKRRLDGEPSAYITGVKEFYGNEFNVDRRVLIPRPESELLVEKALEIASKFKNPVFADIGTGCGALAISIALKLPEAKIYATDISSQALEVAHNNCLKYSVENRVTLFIGNLLKPLPEAVDIVIANLPYVKKEDMLIGNHEPAIALDGGKNGTSQIEKLLSMVADKLRPVGNLLIEIGLGQAKYITELTKKLYPDTTVEVFEDIAGIERVIRVTFK